MSWSFNAVGRPHKIAKMVHANLDTYRCPQPEESIKNFAAGLICTALNAYPIRGAVRVEAYGSQAYGGDLADGHAQSVKIEITPLAGWVE